MKQKNARTVEVEKGNGFECSLKIWKGGVVGRIIVEAVEGDLISFYIKRTNSSC